jgi:2-dehydropantoate 2-reductase
VLEKLSAHVAPERLVAGMVGMASWWAPMEGSEEKRERRVAEGVAYFFPPFGPTQLSGARADAAVAALRRGGAPAKRSRDVGPGQAFASAILMPLVAALETVGWSFARFRRTEAKALAASAALEAIEAAARASGSPPPLSRFAMRPWLLGLGVALARLFAPFDVEAFFRAHFLKVGAQTRWMLDQSIAEARDQGVEPSSLARLRRALD